jgi:hypothetical protein
MIIQDDGTVIPEAEDVMNQAPETKEPQVPYVPGAPFGVNSGTTTIRLPSGQVISLYDWSWQRMRSSFIVDAQHTDSAWDLFTYSRGQAVPGSVRPATRGHTNVPRSGDIGLPRDWEMLVYKWNALINAPLEQPVLDWASETSVVFEYAYKQYASEVLVDLILDDAPIAGEAADPTKPAMPVNMRENLNYQVSVRTESESAIRGLRDWLRGAPQQDAVKSVVSELDGLINIASKFEDDKVISGIVQMYRDMQARLNPGRTLTCWVRLEGLIKRTIV